MAVNNSTEECQNAHSVVVLPDGGTNNVLGKPLLDLASYVEVPKLMTSEMRLSKETNCLNYNSKTDKAVSYAPCVLDIDIEKGDTEMPKSTDNTVGSLKMDDSLMRALQREISLHIGGKLVQFLVNHSPELPKFTSRDTPTHRSRKFKRSASFNSRRVVLLFSILSSMGTIILIYLTLRVRQMGDGSGNV